MPNLSSNYINFTSNNTQFAQFAKGRSRNASLGRTTYQLQYITSDSVKTVVCEQIYDDEAGMTSNTWLDDAYKTVTFETEPTGNLPTWLTNNATKTG